MGTRNCAPPGWKYIYRPWLRDPRTGLKRYPRKAKVFRLLVPDDGKP